MVLTNEKKKEYMKRLAMSRLRILMSNGFYGLLLMHLIYALDDNCKTAATDGKRIYFGPEFLETISDTELDFVMMHEVLHVVLQHCFRQGDRDNERFNIACDIVVNSNILLSNNMNRKTISLKKYGESMHIAPDGKEGYNYTAEQVYDMLSPICRMKDLKQELGGGFDDHSRWGNKDDESLIDEWKKYFVDACEAIIIRDPSNKRGSLPLFAKRLFKELRRPQTDWRTILNDFVQTDVLDYSFAPPDRRFDDSPFFLPALNENDECVEDILFMIDTSGSMSDAMITDAYSEVNGAIEQFNGKLKGWLGFFDAAVVEPKRFTSPEEFEIIKAYGGGGTDFGVIFDFVRTNMSDNLPTCIIILTDGYAPFPKETLSMGIPVLWIINNMEVTPPWGKVARIS